MDRNQAVQHQQQQQSGQQFHHRHDHHQSHHHSWPIASTTILPTVSSDPISSSLSIENDLIQSSRSSSSASSTSLLSSSFSSLSGIKSSTSYQIFIPITNRINESILVSTIPSSSSPSFSNQAIDFIPSIDDNKIVNELIHPILSPSSLHPTITSSFTASSTSISSSSAATASTSITSSPFPTESLITFDTLLTLILPYSIIFVLSIVGNLLVIITLTLDRSMRSVTNIFLLNLAISDQLLGVFCMPFTLVGVLLRRFIFGPVLCHLISYFQAVSVAVSVWTLTAMSIERYYAICHPFRSRESRQTKKHAYRILALIWTLALITMSPTAIVSRLQQIKQTGFYKCREAWPSFLHKQVFTIFLDVVLLIGPLVIMVMTYSSIALTLRNNIHCDRKSSKSNQGDNHSPHQRLYKNFGSFHRTLTTTNSTSKGTTEKLSPIDLSYQQDEGQRKNHKRKLSTRSFTRDGMSPKEPNTAILIQTNDSYDSSKSYSYQQKRLIRNDLHNSDTSTDGQKHLDDYENSHSNSNSSIAGSSTIRTKLRINYNNQRGSNRQRRIITMLFVVVIEFFICWSPIFILDTMALYRPAMVYGTSKKFSDWIGIDIISLCHLLCFCSSCTNPITYCFMNRRFRDHFKSLFRCQTVNQNSQTITQNLSSAK
ncbi:Cholecystokinin receptor type A [Sarcoptes scabiei]|uniref:Cholecystokinin receptor type A n=1 Tax=Sarcoptes scabiei TaxID=52283 RepID=A0A834VAI7_SARSC|nr:Cholecystokinin receptor type A [Sarcoptes scabiei]